ncbi:unnamed protein product [Rotaria sp. Silwood2]|nr:unnamed protein product [Rotaria sp. Silwood2]
MDTVSITDGIPQNPNEERFKQLVEKFKVNYNGIQPQFLCRAPGRVNLIGEHIDYCGYSVLPMAIDQDIVSVSATCDNNEVKIHNTDESFEAGSFNMENFSISYEKSDWYEYFKCGIQGIRDKFPDIKLKGIKKILMKKIFYTKGVQQKDLEALLQRTRKQIANVTMKDDLTTLIDLQKPIYGNIKILKQI